MGKRITVYCASSDVLDIKYKEAARDFAREASLLEYNVVCGGTTKGLMKIIADEMIAVGGNVSGVIPHFMCEKGLEHKGIKDIVYTQTLSQRKENLRNGSDTVVVFPGGIGTLDEFFETMVLKWQGQFSGKLVLFNQEGYYDQLIALFNNFYKEKTINDDVLNSVIIVKDLDELFEQLVT
ncbi:MAG: TIGR00730 family Rossman fold protein [Bacteroidales bacterium]|nr:TIGR00730 family Rossman fold protein [Bacteroidales bacterium]